MALITLNSYSFPCNSLPDGDYEVRYWYNQGFIDSSGQPIGSGTATSGFQIRVAAAVAGGFLTVQDSAIYTTIDSQGPFPQSINLTCRLFRGNSGTNVYPFNQSGCPSSWLIYNPGTPSVDDWDFDSLAFLQQASYPAYQQQWMVTNQEMIDYVNSVQFNVPNASTTVKGIGRVSYPPVSPSIPIFVGDNDPRLVTISVLGYGAVADAVIVEDGAVSASTTAFTSASSAFTAALIGQSIVVVGAGTAGATLVTTIAAVPSGTSLTLGTPAVTTVTGARVVYGTDNSTPFQDALDDAAASSYRAVYAPKGNYLFATNPLNVPQGIMLAGDWAYPPSFMGYRFSDEPKPMSGEGTMLVVVVDEGLTTDPFVQLNSNSGVRGMGFFYPAQVTSLSTPKTYPWTINMYGTACNVQDIALVNPYRGIFSHIGERQSVRNVQGQPLNMGLYVSQQPDTSIYENISFTPTYTFSSTGIAPYPLTNLANYVARNLIAFQVGFTANSLFVNCFSFMGLVGYKFVIDSPEVTPYAGGTGAPGGAAWANFINCGVDGFGTGVRVVDVQGTTYPSGANVKFTNGDFAAYFWAQGGGGDYANTNTILTDTTFTGSVSFVNCTLVDGQNVSLQGSGWVGIHDSWVIRWHGAAAIITANSVKLSLTGNHFKDTGAAVTLGGTSQMVASANTYPTAELTAYTFGSTTKWSYNDNFSDNTAGWVAVTFANGWVNFSPGFQPVSYYKPGNGFVYLRGTAKDGIVSIASAIFTLPAGLRPALNIIFAVSSNGAFGNVVVQSDGFTAVAAGSNVSVSLDGINFPVR